DKEPRGRGGGGGVKGRRSLPAPPVRYSDRFGFTPWICRPCSSPESTGLPSCRRRIEHPASRPLLSPSFSVGAAIRKSASIRLQGGGRRLRTTAQQPVGEALPRRPGQRLHRLLVRVGPQPARGVNQRDGQF